MDRQAAGSLVRHPVNGVVLIAGYISQNTVDKTGQILKSPLSGKLHCFITGCRVRNMIHFQYLINRHSEDDFNRRFDFIQPDTGKLTDHAIQKNLIFQCSPEKPTDKSSVPAYPNTGISSVSGITEYEKVYSPSPILINIS